MKKYNLLILILIFIQFSTQIWCDELFIKPELTARFNVGTILKKGSKESSLANEINKIRLFFNKRYLVKLTDLYVTYSSVKSGNVEISYLVIRFKNGRFIRNFMNYPEKRMMNISGGYTLYAINDKQLILTNNFNKISSYILGLNLKNNFNKKSLDLKINSIQYFKKYKLFKNIIDILEMSNSIEFLSSGKKVKIIIVSGSGNINKIKKSIKDVVDYEYKHIDELNKREGYNFWIRNYGMFVRSFKMKKSGIKLIISGKTIENSEELIVRTLIPEIYNFIEKIVPNDNKKVCEMNRNKIDALIYFMLENGIDGKKIRRRMRRDRKFRNLRCPSGGEYYYEENGIDGGLIKCSIHGR